MSRSSRAGRRARRLRRSPAIPGLLTAAVVAMLVVGPAGSGRALGTDTTPAPTPPAAPAFPCPAGQTPTQATAPPPTKPVSPARTPNPATTTRPDGSTVTTTCATAPPLPFAGPAISPEHTVGGPLLARSGVILDAPPSVPQPPVVTDVSYVISDLDTGQVLAAKSPHALLLPASTLKTLTALVVIPALSPTTVVTASREAVSAEGTRVGIVEGNPYTVDQLLTGLVLISGNDTAYALADAYGGRAKLLAAMNQRAQELGAWDTVAKDPSGLDEDGQRSSAYDLALLGRAVMQLPEFRRYALMKDFTFPGGTDKQGKVSPPFQIGNRNLLLANYAGTIGVKNGYTSGARHTFIGAATRGGRTLLITQMGGVVVPSWEPTAALLDWAFAHASALRPIGQLVAPGAPQPPEWRSGGSPAPTSAAAAPAPPRATSASGGSTPDPTSAPVAAPAAPETLERSALTWAAGATSQPMTYAVLVLLLGAALLLRRRHVVQRRAVQRRLAVERERRRQS